jgi:hypothetical protein
MNHYDAIMQDKQDIDRIADHYDVSPDAVHRAKDYAFGSGVTKYRFVPNLEMAEAWHRMATAQATDLDELLLRHELLESDLVINQGMDAQAAHILAHRQYPWSELRHQGSSNG